MLIFFNIFKISLRHEFAEDRDPKFYQIIEENLHLRRKASLNLIRKLGEVAERLPAGGGSAFGGNAAVLPALAFVIGRPGKTVK